jgi:hypothetical protein
MAKIKRNRLERFDWKDYELQILKFYRNKYPNKIVLDDQMYKGLHSNQNRQIDVVVYSKWDKPYCIIECKNLNRKVTIEHIDCFIGKLQDVGLKRGIIATTIGFSNGAQNYANKKKIELEKITFEFLKDYYYMEPNQIDEIFNKSISYYLVFCDICDISSLYEIVEISGFAETESLCCPKCKKVIIEEIRSDGNHRVIKLFRGKDISEKELTDVKVIHIYQTRNEWINHNYQSIDVTTPFSNINHCFICHYRFCENPPTRTKIEYNHKAICSECLICQRSLLIDYDYI